MHIERVPPAPQPPVFNIMGLTEDEAVYLRDLVGKFAAGNSSLPATFHARLYKDLHHLTEHIDIRHNFRAGAYGLIEEIDT